MRHPRAQLAKAEQELRDAHGREEGLQEDLEVLQDGELGSPGRILERLPCQWLLALLAGAMGLLGILGPQAVFEAFIAFNGSACAGLAMVCSVGCLASVHGGYLDDGRRGLVDPLECLFYGTNFTIGRWLWVLVLLLGIVRWCTGFECAIFAVVDEEESCELPGGEEGEEEEGAADYLVDNSKLGTNARFLAYRMSKRLDHKDEGHLAAYGSIVHGLDEGDGWLRVGSRFLPMQVRGVPVLVLQPREARRSSEAPSGITSRGSHPPKACTISSEVAAPSNGTEDHSREGLGGEAARAPDSLPVSFEEFAKKADELCAGSLLSRVQLQEVWEASGGNFELAVEKALQKSASKDAVDLVQSKLS